MTAKMITANPDRIETVNALIAQHPLAALFGGVMLLAAISYKLGF